LLKDPSDEEEDDGPVVKPSKPSKVQDGPSQPDDLEAATENNGFLADVNPQKDKKLAVFKSKAKEKY